MHRKAEAILQAEYLTARSKILDLAATLDRIDRGQGSVADTAQMKLLMDAMKILLGDEGDRAKAVQLHFSRSYESDWRTKLAVDEAKR
jgi:hypothetical protein